MTLIFDTQRHQNVVSWTGRIIVLKSAHPPPTTHHPPTIALVWQKTPIKYNCTALYLEKCDLHILPYVTLYYASSSPGTKSVILREADGPLTLSQCTLAGPVYTGMPLECHWLTLCILGYHWATQWILAGYTGIPVEKLSRIRPTLGCHWRNSNFCSLHWNTTGGTVPAHTRPDTYS